MKKILIFQFVLVFGFGYSQNSELRNLKFQKKEIQNEMSVLEDSIKKIETRIRTIEAQTIESNNFTVKSAAFKGGKIRSEPSDNSLVEKYISGKTDIVIIGYETGFYEVCVENICGYLRSGFVNESFPGVKEFRNKRQEEIKRIYDEEFELKFLSNQEKKKFLEEKYIKKYGKTLYESTKNSGKFWIGMSTELALISKGEPKRNNRSVGAWGVHEQWVYFTTILYFENGILTSYQD